MKTFISVLKIEGKLSIRDMNMIIFALIMPLVVLVIQGIIYGQNKAYAGANYSTLEQSFGALCSIAICAGGLMGLPIVISDYRERKILKRFQVTPISPAMILLVEVVIYTLYSFVSVVLLWLVAVLFFGFIFRGSLVLFFAGWFLVLFSMLGIGMLVGGIAKNTKQASVIASVLYFPMLIFSGATLPYEVMPRGMQIVVDLMPLTQGIKILKAAVLGLPIENVLLSVICIVALTLLCTAGSIRFFRWE